MNTFSDRLRYAMEKANKKPMDLVKAPNLKISPAGVSKWLGGKVDQLKYSDAKEVAQLLGVNADWLMMGIGDIEKPKEKSPVLYDSNITGNLIKIEKIDLYAGCDPAGELCGDSEPDVEFMWVTPDWFREYFPFQNSDHIKMIMARGDSMTPTVRDGDVVFIDTTLATSGREGIYAIYLDGNRLIKRLQFIGNRSLLLLSDNPKYRDVKIDADSTLEFRILGKVLKAFRMEDLS